MPLDVLSMIRGARRARASELETLAARLFKGEQIPPHDVLRELTECGGTDEQLQAEIDRLERVRDLRESARDVEPARAELTRLDAEIAAAQAAAKAAADALAAVQAKHHERRMDLRHRIDAADRARDRLLQPENLSVADRTALDVAQQEQQRTARAHGDAHQQLTQARERVARMQQQLADQQDDERRSHKPIRGELRDALADSQRALTIRQAAAKDAEQADAAAAKAAAAAELALTQLMQRLAKGVTR